MAQEESFAFSTPDSVSQQRSAGYVGSNSGVQGGETTLTTQAVGVPKQPANDTLGLLLSLGGELLRKPLEQKKTEAFVSGMQQAAQGKAIQDIASEEPWYAHVFGYADAAEGARAYLGHTRAHEAVSAMEDQMPELRKMDGPQAQKFFTDTVNSKLTGDKAADLSIMKSMTQVLPAFMTRQAKEHYGYKQESASAAEEASFASTSGYLQKVGQSLKDGFMTQEAYDVQVQQFINDSAPAQGRDIASWQKSRTQGILGALDRGELHAVNALREHGALDALTDLQRNHIEKATDAAEARVRSKYSFDWSDRLGDIFVQADHPPPGTTPEQVVAKADALNSNYQKETGSKLGLISPAERLAIQRGSAGAIYAERMREWEHQRTEGAKVQTAEEKARVEAQAVNEDFISASGGTLYLRKMVRPDEKMTAAVYEKMRSLPTEAQNKIMVDNGIHNYVIAPIAADRDGEVTAAIGATANGVPGNSMVQAYGRWETLHKANPEVASMYYRTNGLKMERMKRALDAGIPFESAYTSAFVNPQPPNVLNEKELAATVKDSRGTYDGWTPAFLGKPKLTDESAMVVSKVIKQSAGEWSAVLGNDAGGRRAFSLAVASKQLEVLGGHAWQNQTGNKVALSDWLVGNQGKNGIALPEGKQDEVMKLAVDRRIAETIPAGQADRVVITRDADGPENEPRFIIHALSKDGTDSHTSSLTGSQIFGYYKRENAKFVAPQVPKNLKHIN